MAQGGDKQVNKARKTVESAIKRLGIDPSKNEIRATPGGAAWSLARGSAAVMIAINPGVGEAPARLRMVSPIVKPSGDVPVELYRRLLELNATELPGLSFGLLSGEIVLVTERSVLGLDRSEVEEMLGTLGHFADEYDDLLVKEFGGTRVTDLGE